MASEVIDIRVREDGSRVVKRNLEDVGDSATKAKTGVDLFKDALKAIAVAETIRQLIELADTFTNIENRIRIVTQSTAELNVVNQELFRISNETRQSYEATVETYSRVALSAKALGVSQQDLLTFTENLNKAIAVSGANAQTAQNGMIQLAQGMAAGRLQGQDLRAVLEDIPTVGDVIAQHFGVTRGQLRQMGEQGKITAKDIIAAFTQGGNEIQEKFAKTVPTIGQSFVVLKNHVVELVGSFASGNGITQAFAQTVIFLADHLDELSRIVALAAIVIGVNFAVDAIGAAIAGLEALAAAALANPFTAILEVLLLVIAALTVFSDKIQLGAGHMANLQDLAVAVWNNIKGAVQAFLDWFNSNFGFIVKWFQDTFGQADLSLAGFLNFAAKIVDAYIGYWLGAYRAIIAAFTNFPQALSDIIARAVNSVIGQVEAFINGVITAINAVSDFAGLGKIDPVQIARAKDSGLDYGQTVGEAFLSGFKFSGAEDAVNNLLNDADKIAAQRQQRDAAAKAAEDAARAHLGDHGSAANIPDPDAAKKLKAYQEARNALISLLSVVDPVESGILKLAKDQDTLTKAQKLGIISTADLTRYMAALKAQSDLDILGPILSKADPTRAAMTELTQLEQRLAQARKAGLVTAQQEADYLARLKKAYEEATDPLKHMTDELTAQIKIAGENQRQREVDSDLRSRVLDLQQKGVYLTQAETEALRQQLVVLQQTNEAQGIRDQLLNNSVEKRRTDLLNVQQAGKLAQDPNSGFTKSDAFNAATQQTGTTDLFTHSQEAVDAQIARFQEMYRQIDAMRQADIISEQSAERAKAQVDIQMQELRLSNARDLFGQLAQLSHSKNRELAAIGRAAAATQATIDGVLAVQKALASYPPPYNFAMAAVVGAVAAANVAEILTANTNFATGGSFMVGGTGGVDSQILAIRATPGERVSVQTPSQVRHGSGANDGGQGAGNGAQPQVNLKNINVLDPAMVGDFLQTPEGEQVLMNVMRRNGDTVRGIASGG